jgi:very-short-patch-repair endonuclease
MASLNKKQMYRFCADMLNDLYSSTVTPHMEKISQIKISQTSTKNTRIAFLQSQKPVSGRGNVGILEEGDGYSKLNIPAVPFGGKDSIPLNGIAQYECYPREQARLVEAAKNNKDAPKQPIVYYTNLEKQLYSILLSANLPYALYAQYFAGPNLEYRLDAAIPALKLGIEADSETYHSDPENIQRDRKRDSILASQGWTVLRFTDSEIEDHPQQVVNVISTVIKKLNNPNPNNVL